MFLYVAAGCIGSAIAFLRILTIPEFEPIEERFTTFEGVVAREPEIFDRKQRFVVKTDSFDFLVQIDASLHPRVIVGERVLIDCFLQNPKPFDGFAYDIYLRRYSIGALCFYPKIEKRGYEDSFFATMYGMKKYAMDRFQKSMAPPENMMIIGALFGNKRALPEHINLFFQRTGTSHVIVISGLHIVMLIALMSKGLYFLGFSKKTQSLGSIVLIFFYIAITGFQASAVRAGIFGMFTLGSSFFGRKHSAFRILFFAAAGMLFINPLLFWHDVGFQLSFASTAGIILWNTPIEKKLFFLPKTLRPLLSVTFASMIPTAPIIFYHFHTFTPIGILANILLVPMMTGIMIAGMGSIFISLFSVETAHTLSLPLYFVIHFFIDIARWFSSFPFATFYFDSL